MLFCNQECAAVFNNAAAVLKVSQYTSTYKMSSYNFTALALLKD